MRGLLLWLLLVLTCPSWGQVLQEGDLSATFDLRLSGGQPIMAATFFNMSARPISLLLPAGVTLVGQREPCQPVALGRDLEISLPAGGYTEVSVEALSLSFAPHAEGPYNLAYPDDLNRALCVVVQRVWRRYHSGGLAGSPLRLAQLVAYIATGASLEQVHPTFTEAEIHEAARVLREQQ